jgi:glycosyltransferase involved in cell wall biosynthesis
MRILMLAPHPQIRSPLQKHTPPLVAALRQLGCTVELEGWGRHREQETLGEKVTGRLTDIGRIRRRLRARTFDVLVIKTAHDWNTLSRDIPLLVATRGLCAHQVVQFHGCFVDRLVASGRVAFKAASALLLRLCDAALVLSCEEQRQWLAFHPRGKVYVVSNPFVSSDGAITATARRDLGVPEGVPLLLFVGRVMEAKGVFELIEALPRVLADAPCHLLMAGEGPEMEAFRARAAAVGITEHLTMAGYLEGPALRAAYGCSDVFVLPSWTEGFPFSMLEAMDAGLPVVTTRIRGMADHIEDGVHGFLTAPRDSSALAEALRRLVTDAGLRRRMGEANRAKVREFAPDRVARQYLEVLDAVTRTPQAGGGTCAA